MSLVLLFLAMARSAAFDASLVFDMKRRFSSWLSDAPDASKVAEKISRRVSFVISLGSCPDGCKRGREK